MSGSERGHRTTEAEAEDGTSRDLEAVVRDRLAQLDETERLVLAEVLRLEHDKLHLVLPRGIKQDIADVVRRLVK
jgi:hypothetical protein